MGALDALRNALDDASHDVLLDTLRQLPTTLGVDRGSDNLWAADCSQVGELLGGVLAKCDLSNRTGSSNFGLPEAPLVAGVLKDVLIPLAQSSDELAVRVIPGCSVTDYCAVSAHHFAVVGALWKALLPSISQNTEKNRGLRLAAFHHLLDEAGRLISQLRGSSNPWDPRMHKIAKFLVGTLGKVDPGACLEDVADSGAYPKLADLLYGVHDTWIRALSSGDAVLNVVRTLIPRRSAVATAAKWHLPPLHLIQIPAEPDSNNAAALLAVSSTAAVSSDADVYLPAVFDFIGRLETRSTRCLEVIAMEVSGERGRALLALQVVTVAVEQAYRKATSKSKATSVLLRVVCARSSLSAEIATDALQGVMRRMAPASAAQVEKTIRSILRQKQEAGFGNTASYSRLQRLVECRRRQEDLEPLRKALQSAELSSTGCQGDRSSHHGGEVGSTARNPCAAGAAAKSACIAAVHPDLSSVSRDVTRLLRGMHTVVDALPDGSRRRVQCEAGLVASMAMLLKYGQVSHPQTIVPPAARAPLLAMLTAARNTSYVSLEAPATVDEEILAGQEARCRLEDRRLTALHRHLRARRGAPESRPGAL